MCIPSCVKRHELFPLAALSNRSIPLATNFEIVGPPFTTKSHGMLVMLNTYSIVSTFISKLVVLSLERNLLLWLVHIFHFGTTCYAILYSIRLRQIAFDIYEIDQVDIQSGNKIFPDIGNLSDDQAQNTEINKK